MFLCAQNTLTLKVYLACRPPLEILLRELPTREKILLRRKWNLVPTDVQVIDVIKKLTITQEEIDFRRDIIYGMDPLVRVQNMKTYFPQEKTVFGKVTKWVKRWIMLRLISIRAKR
jgi:peptide/nickel transport system ATP-binding protein